jgi:hypothetical protein
MARCAIYGVVRLFEGINDERSPQARASRMIVRNRAAPSVALITARINPEPRLMPSRGKSQLAMNAPTTPHATTARRRKIRRLRRKSSIIPLLNPQRRSPRLHQYRMERGEGDLAQMPWPNQISPKKRSKSIISSTASTFHWAGQFMAYLNRSALLERMEPGHALSGS